MDTIVGRLTNNWSIDPACNNRCYSRRGLTTSGSSMNWTYTKDTYKGSTSQGLVLFRWSDLDKALISWYSQVEETVTFSRVFFMLFIE
ncbi:hypothetical protein TNCV_4928101 [Trichonephila clavipes]|nr:hypothetical protein TNCV_4928101 [Trichonephila clavipes]